MAMGVHEQHAGPANDDPANVGHRQYDPEQSRPAAPVTPTLVSTPTMNEYSDPITQGGLQVIEENANGESRSRGLQMKGFVADIEELTQENDDFRRFATPDTISNWF